MTVKASGTITFIVTVEYDDVTLSECAECITDGIEEPDWVDGRSVTATFPGAFSIKEIEMHQVLDEDYVDLAAIAEQEENERLAKEHEENRIEVESRYV
jgi:hypothetical protein